MISNTQVLFRGIESSPSVEEIVHKRLEKLERYSDKIQSLKVVLEAPHQHHHKGRVWHVSVEALIPNHDIVVAHDHHDNHAHEDIYVAIRDAFNAIERRLKSVTSKQQSRRQGKRVGEGVGGSIGGDIGGNIGESVELKVRKEA
ncbi:MAG TPA: ribosome-associated translation inhibitor RaiA [Candidatus Acidoferrum sp.]|nr:ribosome-associated translation inhibitor RaiA [Candidatus Acidoferrum sp.]